MEELKPNKEIPNIVNVDDIQSIIDTNKILQDRIDKAIKCINHYAIEDEDYSKIYSQEEQELLKIFIGSDKE